MHLDISIFCTWDFLNLVVAQNWKHFIIKFLRTTFVQLLICLLCNSWGDRRQDFSASQLTEGWSARLMFDGSECWSDSASNDGTGWLSLKVPDNATTGEVSSKLGLSTNWIPNSLGPFPVLCLFSPQSLLIAGEKDSVATSTWFDQYIVLLEMVARLLFPPKLRGLGFGAELNLGDG